RVLAFGDDEAAEIVSRLQRGIAQQVETLLAVFTAADGGDDVVRADRGHHFVGADVERGDLRGIDPHAHGWLAPAADVDALHALDAGQERRYLALHEVGELGAGPGISFYVEVEQGRRTIGAHHFHGGIFRAFGQFITDLRKARREFRECARAVGIQFEPCRDAARAGRRRAVDIVDA